MKYKRTLNGMKTNVVICGCNGHMGRVVQSVIEGRNDCQTVAGIDLHPEMAADSSFPIYTKISEMTEKPDVIIDFSHPSALDDLLDYCLINGTPAVLACTGYAAVQTEQIKKASGQIPVFFTANMSLGINLLVELVKKAAAVLGGQFDVEIIEKHHNRKIDAPSGTALLLADAVKQTMNAGHYVYDRHSVRKKRQEDEIGIHSVRGGTIVGEHDVIFAGRDEVITLSHQAASKEVFAVGAVNAALFLASRKPGLYAMSDLL